jgi:hypothetical protein
MPSNLTAPPKSSIYPSLVTIQRILPGSSSLFASSIPYHGTATDGVNFFEFRGRGIVPADIGRLGDVYWDVTFPYIIYFVGIDGWKPWNPQASEGSQKLARHPVFDDRYLWISDDGFSWLTQKSLSNSLVRVRTHVAQTLDQELLAALLQFSPTTATLALDLEENRRRDEAEAQRRRLNGVPLSQPPKPIQRQMVESTEESSNTSSALLFWSW